MADSWSLGDIFEQTSYKDWFSLSLKGVELAAKAKTDYANGMAESGDFLMKATSNAINSERMLMNIDAITTNFENEANAVRIQNEQLKGKQKEAMSASGFEVESGSYIDYENQADYVASKTIATLNREYMFNVAENEFQAKALSIQSRLEREQSKIAMKNAKRAKTYGTIAGVSGLVAGLAGAYGQKQYNANKMK